MSASKGQGVGWAEALGQEQATNSPEFIARRRAGKKVPRRVASHDYACGVNGSRQGHAAQRLNRVLGPVTEEDA